MSNVELLSSPWHELAARVLEGHKLTAEEGLAILNSEDHELLDLLAAAYRVRRRWCGDQVHLNFLINAKSGLCSEDCGYCSQSKTSRADIPQYNLLETEQLLDGARLAAERKARTYCIVTSGRQPSERDLAVITQVVPQIKANHKLNVCVSPGLITAEQAKRLKQCGVDRVNHNLNTSERFYPSICTTHAYQDRLDTLSAVRQAGLQICSGGIVGLGEEKEDVVELALRLSELAVDVIPINFLIPIEGTSLEDAGRPDSRYCLKVLSLVRMANPKCELRIAGGREINLGSLQPLGLYPANGIFVGDYLTTKGQPANQDYRMIEDLGFEVIMDGVR